MIRLVALLFHVIRIGASVVLLWYVYHGSRIALVVVLALCMFANEINAVYWQKVNAIIRDTNDALKRWRY